MLLLGPWLWYDESGFGYHGPPPECRAAIDLTPAIQLSEARPGVPRGTGLFLVDRAPLDGEYEILSGEDLRDARPDQRTRDAWQALTGYRPGGDTLADLVWDHLTAGSDPAGIDQPSPLVPESDGRLRLVFGGEAVRDERFGWGRHPHTSRLRDLVKRELQSCREAAHAGELIDCRGTIDNERHRRVADALCAKYAVDLEQIRPFRWPDDESRLPHETTAADSFDRSNGAMGSSSEGWSWNGLSGTMQISSNRATVTAAVARYRAEVDLTSSDNEAGVTVTTRSGNLEIIARYQAAADTCYRCLVSSGQVRIFKTIGGTQTQVGSTVSTPWPATPFSIGMRCNGSTLDALVNGVSLNNVASDTSITSGTRCGLGGSAATGQTYDDWLASDLVAGSILIHPGMAGRFRELTGGLRG